METNAISQTVEHYFKALYECDVDTLRKLFVPSVMIYGYYEGELIQQKLPEYLKVIRRMSSPAMLGEEIRMSIIRIESSGTIAAVTTQYLFEALLYTEYLNLLKIDEEWKIVSKTFRHE